jgi:hypothetical protein
VSVFIVRPFDKKTTKSGVEIDFEKVHVDLILPALKAAGLSGGTTGDILRSGNIRRDMFQSLLTADLVIADLSIHNANVFYELGIRHALRDKRTYLIRSKSDEVPFDLKTDRYLEYDRDNPGASKDDLAARLRATLDSESNDSPIFEYLPTLAAVDPGRFVIVPRGFREDVARAAGEGRSADIALFASEVGDQDWGPEALRLAARALSALNTWRSAAVVWERIRGANELDREANLALGEAYQRLEEFGRSDQALGRLLERSDLLDSEQASALALIARNTVHHWMKQSKDAGGDAAIRALRSTDLKDAFDRYFGAFQLNLQSFNLGCNALWVGTLLLDLALKHQDIWAEGFETDELAQVELSNRKQSLARLHGAVVLALELAERRNSKLLKTDFTLLRCRAEVACATTDGRSQRVAAEYRRAAVAADSLDLEELRQRLKMFQGVGIRTSNVDAALGVLYEVSASLSTAKPTASGISGVAIVFCSEGIDSLGFSERVLIRSLRSILSATMTEHPRVTAFTGGSPAGLVFYEICEELGIPTSLWLSYPRAEYRANMAVPAGDKWSKRFDEVADRAVTKVLQASAVLPPWLSDSREYTQARRTLTWMLHNASNSGLHVNLILPEQPDAAAGLRESRDVLARLPGVDIRFKYIQMKSNDELES